MYEDEQPTSSRKTIGFAAGSAAALSLLCIFIGEGARHFADSLDSPILAAAQTGKKPTFNAIDYATTGAIHGQTVILSPCDR